METNFIFSNHHSASLEMPLVAQLQSEVPFEMAPTYNNNNSVPPIETVAYGQPYVPHITTTPVVKSHNIMYQQQHQQHDQNLTFIDNNMTTSTTMDIDYFDHVTAATSNHGNMVAIDPTFNNMQSIYSPSMNSVTTNSSVMMMDTLSPISPINMMSPTTHLMSHGNNPMDTFVAPVNVSYMMTGDNMSNNNGYFHHVIAQPATVESQNYLDRKAKRSLPRRHTVSTPYDTNTSTIEKSNEAKTTVTAASKKSSLKAKRHRSMGKLDIYAQQQDNIPPVPNIKELSNKLEHWTHQELLQRVIELEKEKKVAASVAQIANGGVMMNSNTYVSQKGLDKVRSNSQTDNEEEDDEEDIEEEEEGGSTEEEQEEQSQKCQWEDCDEEFNKLEELTNHVKADHIGSGKTQYYCLWKDCPRQQKPFTKRHKMHNHLRTHTGERPFICTHPDCGKKFSRPDSLTTHVKIHSNIRPYLCKQPNCDKAYYHLRSLRKHEKTHMNNNDNNNDSNNNNNKHQVTQSATSQLDNMSTAMVEQDIYSDWALSTQAAVFDVMETYHV
ncbi:hypothetical protein BCV72DRAFT_136098 [Rhizopus microsporus var. microsporus]|uniref:C2H2-type domain-containing protein n=2 Tax=Rhizopus microsporus TaxID=58291 RepID=A0A1X0R0S5_RHIZD|nr:hypothetical protein BCV72DRAFT_136098 [Rhizopus microsporus var. microsporus]